MSVVGAVQERQDRPALVRFARRAVEDKKATLEQGKWVGKDVDFALITPPYSKDCIEIKVEQWKQNMMQDVKAGRLPQAWQEHYLKAHEAWQNGQELPPTGTPIRGWGMLSPAQQEMLIRINILTIEDLAGINDEGVRRIGMGALDLKRKASAWIQQVNDKGPLTQKMAAVEAENDSLKTQVALLTEKLDRLIASIPAQAFVQAQAPRNDEAITADDILPESEPVKRKK